MGLKDWLKRGPKNEGKSPGGSAMLRYGGGEFDVPSVGFTEESFLPLQEQRETQYTALFGEVETVYHELLPFVPHIDVFIFKPGTRGRPFFTYVTSGMSDLPMTIPRTADPELAVAELIFYADEANNDYAELLRKLAHFPHENRTWLGSGHTMPNGTPPQPFFGSSELDTVLFMPTIVRPESNEKLTVGDKLLNLLWVVPLTTRECELKLNEGVGAIYALFDRVNHPVAFSPSRKSYV